MIKTMFGRGAGAAPAPVVAARIKQRPAASNRGRWRMDIIEPTRDAERCWFISVSDFSRERGRLARRERIAGETPALPALAKPRRPGPYLWPRERIFRSSSYRVFS